MFDPQKRPSLYKSPTAASIMFIGFSIHSPSWCLWSLSSKLLYWFLSSFFNLLFIYLILFQVWVWTMLTCPHKWVYLIGRSSGRRSPGCLPPRRRLSGVGSSMGQMPVSPLCCHWMRYFLTPTTRQGDRSLRTLRGKLARDLHLFCPAPLRRPAAPVTLLLESTLALCWRSTGLNKRK